MAVLVGYTRCTNHRRRRLSKPHEKLQGPGSLDKRAVCHDALADAVRERALCKACGRPLDQLQGQDPQQTRPCQHTRANG
jgi:hypothetical protein